MLLFFLIIMVRSEAIENAVWIVHIAGALMGRSRFLSGLSSLAMGTMAITAMACGSDGPRQQEPCVDTFKCDIPDGPDEDLCVLRRNDAFNDNQTAFQEQGLRWSCADVSGVTNEDRGQEYCEYFAMVDLPDGAFGEPAILGRNLGEDYSFGTTEERLDLSYDQLTALEADESAIVGQCVFTSWNSDIPGPVAACAEGSKACPEVLGVPINQEIFGMQFGVNSAEAAQVLVEDCMRLPNDGDSNDRSDPLHDDFYRGCMLNAEINDTAYRKSDSTVCASVVRLAECGCGPVDPEVDLGIAVSPWNRLGFPLGTWSGRHELPAGCQYIEEGEDSDTLVTCDLSAAEVMMGAADLKGYCMDKYGDNVVVHVPFPARDAITCAPETTESPYADSCSATPWVLEPSYK